MIPSYYLGGLVASSGVLPPSAPAAISQVEQIDEIIRGLPQVEIVTKHVLHGGIYSRTICIPADVVLAAALIKIPTTLTICGHASVLIGDGEEVQIKGYHTLPASAGRKQAYIAHEDTWITMSFRTEAKSIEEAEAEFTDEAERLISRQGLNEVVITGE